MAGRRRSKQQRARFLAATSPAVPFLKSSVSYRQCIATNTLAAARFSTAPLRPLKWPCGIFAENIYGRPVYDLLGGRVRSTMHQAYANGWTGAGKDPDDLAGAAREVVARGFTAPKFDPFWSRGRDPATADIRRGIEKVGLVRDAVSSDVDILIDGHGRFGIGTAIDIGRRLADHDVYWFEEPVDPENALALAKVGRSIPVRLATGERCYSRYQVPQLLAASEVVVLQPDPIQVGGILSSPARSQLSPIWHMSRSPSIRRSGLLRPPRRCRSTPARRMFGSRDPSARSIYRGDNNC